MKMQKSFIFVNENLKMNIGKISYRKVYCHYTGEYPGAAHSICDLKYSVPKKFNFNLI